METLKISDNFQKAIDKIKSEKSVDQISEIELFKEGLVDDYFQVLENWDTKSEYIQSMLKNEEFNKFFDGASYSNEDSNYLMRVVYSSERFTAVQKVLK